MDEVISINSEGITTKVREITRENLHMELLMLWLAHSLNKWLQVSKMEVKCSWIEDWEVKVGIGDLFKDIHVGGWVIYHHLS